MSGARSSGDVKKSPLIAAVLALLYPGLGHVYLRRWGRALLWFVLIVSTVVALIPEAAVPTELSVDALLAARSSIPGRVALFTLGISALSVVDAYRIASQSDDESATQADADTVSCPNCGKELDEDLDFCHWCTTRLDDPEE